MEIEAVSVILFQTPSKRPEEAYAVAPYVTIHGAWEATTKLLV
jgi:hypothetical protein